MGFDGGSFCVSRVSFQFHASFCVFLCVSFCVSYLRARLAGVVVGSIAWGWGFYGEWVVWTLERLQWTPERWFLTTCGLWVQANVTWMQLHVTYTGRWQAEVSVRDGCIL